MEKRSAQQAIAQLWDGFRDAIDTAYATGGDHCSCLRDYTRNRGMIDQLTDLLAEESANERRHRRFEPKGARIPLSVSLAAKVVLLANAGRACVAQAMPAPTEWLVYRRSAVEAKTIGALLSRELWPDCEQAAALDYSALMN
jgi:hypothetical protein